MRHHVAAILAALLIGLVPAQIRGAGAPGPALQFSFPGLTGGTVDFADYAGRVILVVNTASKCAFTPQYEGLEALWRQFGPRGLVVIGIPSNDFGGQEPGSEDAVAEFCAKTYDVTFPMTAKAHVKGEAAAPFYRHALTVLGRSNAPRWNFHKYLIGRDGRLVAAFPSQIKPQSLQVRLAIESALATPVN